MLIEIASVVTGMPDNLNVSVQPRGLPGDHTDPSNGPLLSPRLPADMNPNNRQKLPSYSDEYKWPAGFRVDPNIYYLNAATERMKHEKGLGASAHAPTQSSVHPQLKQWPKGAKAK